MSKSANAAPKSTEPNSDDRSTKQPQRPIEPSTPLSPIDRANQAYKLVYGETAKIPIQHESIATAQDSD